MYDQFEYNGTLTDYPARTDWFWIVDSKHNDYANFNFDYTAPSWEGDYIHAFGDQYSKESNTFLVHKTHTQNQGKLYHPETVNRVTHVPIYNAVNLLPYEPDGVRMFSNMFNFIKRMANKTTERYFWVTASVCEYNAFDFLWHPEIGEENFIHAWPSENNKYGYTFFIPTEAFKKQQDSLQKLEWFEYIKMHDPLVHKPLPVNKFNSSKGVAEAIKEHTFTHHYEWFVEDTYKKDIPNYYPGRWDEINLQTFGSYKNVMCVPREAKSYILDQVYDYPHINPNINDTITAPLHDIIFISYDELEADANWEKLKNSHMAKGRAKRLHGVEGMINALKQAAEMATTGYYYAVFAKTQIDEGFNFDHQHDRLSVPSHYIFDCYNPITELEYGHMGIVLYNCDIVLNADEYKLDYTTSFPIKHVKQRSCVSAYNVSPYQTWRTAFRECVKLASNCIPGSNPGENAILLEQWLTVANGKYAEWNIQGAKDAVEFANADQDLYQIMDWKWLKSYFESKHHLTD